MKVTIGDPDQKQLLINESSLISYLDSDEIIKCVDLYEYKNKIWIILDLLDGGDLSSIVFNYHDRYSEDFCKYTLYKVAKGLQKMHGKNVLHRDIKSNNILCSKNGDIKIADLGFSAILSKQQAFRRSMQGTSNWVAPEVISDVHYSKEIDVWSYGAFA